MADFTGTVWGPGLEEILRGLKSAVDVLTAFFKNDVDLRKVQSDNEPLADGYQQGSNVNGVDTLVKAPNNTVQLQSPFTTFLDGQVSTSKKYSYIVVIIASTSGSGRYMLQSGLFPDQVGTGIEIPAGGTTFTIPGWKNIQNLKMCPDAGQTLNYQMQGFV